MIDIYLGHFSKRKNSTARPSQDSFTRYACALKAEVTEDSPAFLLAADSVDATYCIWDDRYYFVASITYVRTGLFEIACNIDALATFKDDIVGKQAFVMYSSGGNIKLPDTRLPQVSEPTISQSVGEFRPDVNTGRGTYVLSVVGDNGSVSSVYTESYSNVAAIMDNIDDWANEVWVDPDPVPEEEQATFIGVFRQLGNIIDALGATFKQTTSVGSATDCIRNLTWIPFDLSGGATVDPLYLGKYDTGLSGFKSIGSTPNIAADVTISIPWQYSDWRNGSKCTQVYLYIPWVGVVSYSADNLVGQTEIHVTSSLAKATGELAVRVRAGNVILGTYGANTGVQYAIGSSNVSPVQVANGLMSGINATMATATGNLMSGFSSLIGMLGSFTPNVSCVGGIGSGAGSGLDYQLRCFTVCHNTIQEPSAVSAVMGTPTYEVEPIPASGYVQTVNASIPLSCNDGERAAINALLDGGIYIE